MKKNSTVENIARRHNKRQQDSSLCSLNVAKAKEFVLRRHPQKTVFQNGHGFGNFEIRLRVFSDLGTKALQPRD